MVRKLRFLKEPCWGPNLRQRRGLGRGKREGRGRERLSAEHLRPFLRCKIDPWRSRPVHDRGAKCELPGAFDDVRA
jgi:hypothetical protein